MPDTASVDTLRGRRLLAFSGIGGPQKFFRTLDDAGLDVVERRIFPDHHRFGAAERQDLLRQAERLQAELVTTAKDRVRLPADFRTHELPVDLVFDDQIPVTNLLDQLSGGSEFRSADQRTDGISRT